MFKEKRELLHISPLIADCVSTHDFQTDRIATSWAVRVWAPREDADARILTLVSENDAGPSLRKIDFTRTELHALFGQGSHREKNSSLLPGDGISPGWAEFRVTSDSRFKVWVAGVAEPLVDVEDDVQAERVFVKGSNVTINCRERKHIYRDLLLIIGFKYDSGIRVHHSEM